MNGKKRLVANCLTGLHLDWLTLRLQKHLLGVVTHHRIRPDRQDFSSPFDQGVYGLTVSEFARQVDWLKEHTHILSEQELIALLEGKAYAPGPYSLITFDDGYRDNFDLAYPVLKERNVPALFFIPSGLIESRQVGWWDQIAYLLKHTPKKQLTVRDQTYDLSQGPSRAIHRLHTLMKDLPHERTETLVQEVAEACGIAQAPGELQNEQLMSWDEVRQLHRDGLGIASHTVHHWVHATLSQDLQEKEIGESKEVLEGKLGAPVRSLATIIRGGHQFSHYTVELAKTYGYQLSFSFQTGVGRLGEINPYWVPRFEAPLDSVELTASYAFPELMYPPRLGTLGRRLRQGFLQTIR